MTTPPTGVLGGIFGQLIEDFSEEFGYSPFEGTKNAKQQDGPKYKLASDLSPGNVIVHPSGEDRVVKSVSLVYEDNFTIEVAFIGVSPAETQYFWKNLRVEVR